MSEVERSEPSSPASTVVGTGTSEGASRAGISEDAPPTVGVSVSLPSFEGPLDLLLHLCQKHELNILDIPIGFITEKYLEFLAVMQLIDLDVASEYLVMAATLAHIKSKMLLPAPPPGQEDDIIGEEEDPRESLIRRLLEYQKYKLAGEQLQARGVAGRDIFLRGMPIEEATHAGLAPLAQVPLFSLVEAFQNVLTKSKIKISHDVVHERITLTDRINELVDVLRVRRRIAFEDLFEHMQTRFDLVITFLALLEMTRLRMTRLFQADFQSVIYIEFSAQVTTDDGEDPPPPPPPEEDERQQEPGEPGEALEAATDSSQAETPESAEAASAEVEVESPMHRVDATIPSPPPDEEDVEDVEAEAASEENVHEEIEAAAHEEIEAAAHEEIEAAAPEEAPPPLPPPPERTRSAFVWLDAPRKAAPASVEVEDSSLAAAPSDVKLDLDEELKSSVVDPSEPSS